LADGAALAQTVAEQTRAHVESIRAIRAEAGLDTEAVNAQLDSAWQFFSANADAVMPGLRAELASELASDSPNQMVLLDIGHFVRLRSEASDKELGRTVFFAIDPDAEIVRWNEQELFQYAHDVARDRDPRMLPFLDRVFLRGNKTAFVPQHAMTLDETLVCVFLYGAHGDGAEDHLRDQLGDRAVAQRVLEILGWLGSPASVPEVLAATTAGRDYETFARATAFMMTMGGPEGRDAMLALDVEGFDAESREYYARVRPAIESVSYGALSGQFDSFPAPAQLTDGELRLRLAMMFENYGVDDELSPRTLLVSSLDTAVLVAELTRIRDRMFLRLSDEALSDVKLTNALLNTLRYKPR
jgi:hypothetical protein